MRGVQKFCAMKLKMDRPASRVEEQANLLLVMEERYVLAEVGATGPVAPVAFTHAGAAQKQKSSILIEGLSPGWRSTSVQTEVC